MKLIHAGDIHLDPRAPDMALASLSKLYEYCVEHKPKALLLAGDLFDRAVPATHQHGMTDVIRVIRAIADVTPVVAIPGTPTHDRPGAYYPLEPFITCLYPGRMWCGNIPGLLVTASLEPGIRAGDGDGDHASAEAAALERTREELRDAELRAARTVGNGGAGIVHVHMHHGAVAAAETETGYYATGAPGELCLFPHDLDIPKARYVALGHIHRQQRVDGIISEAWYCGSAYPTDWGERDQKAALLVTIPDGVGASVAPLPYPHRPRRKWAVNVPHGMDVVDHLRKPPFVIDGCQVWLQVTHDPAQTYGQTARHALLSMLLNATHVAGGHRIDLRAAPREAVIRADLGDVPAWSDQLATWCDVTDSPEPTEAQRKLANNLQAQTAGPDGGQPRSWRIDKLNLRGARGLAGGSLDLDLSSYPPGLLAIAGPNGAGKTTVLEHMCPWPELLTRGGSLSSAFLLGASPRREMQVTDIDGGDILNLNIAIAGSGKRHHAIHMLTKKGAPDMLPDGTTASYTQTVERLFGDRSTYIAGAIQTQRPITLRLRNPDGSSSSCTSDLIQAPAGMRRHLLRAILGLDQYQHGAQVARGLMRDKADQVSRIDAQIDALPAPDHEVYELHAALEREAEAAANLLSTANANVRDLRADEDRLRTAAERTREKIAEQAAARREITSAALDADEAAKRATAQRGHAARLPELEAKLKEMEESRAILDDAQQQADRDRLRRAGDLELLETARGHRRDKALIQHSASLKDWAMHGDAVGDLRSDREDAARDAHKAVLAKWQLKVDASYEHVQDMARLEQAIKQADRDSETAAAECEHLAKPGEPCDKCGQPIGEDKRQDLLAAAGTRAQAGAQAVKDAAQALQELQDAHVDPGPAPPASTPDMSDLDERLREIGPVPVLATPDMSDLDRAAAAASESTEAETKAVGQATKHRDLNQEWWALCDGDRDAMTKARLALARAAAADEDAARAETRKRDARERDERLSREIDHEHPERYNTWQGHLQVAQDMVQTRTREHSTALADLRIAAERLNRETKAADRRVEMGDYLEKVSKELSDAKLLADALAPTGIQALLLESAAPQIAADANAALRDSYGERWQVRLDLQRVGKDKIAEDLRIVVTDTESSQQPSDDQLGPGEQLAETLSGGEATWIRAALSGALALARARHTGQRQLTALLDEADGALSEDARAKYFDLLESLHRALGRHHTIVVTHSQEMLDRLGPERVIRLQRDPMEVL